MWHKQWHTAIINISAITRHYNKNENTYSYNACMVGGLLPKVHAKMQLRFSFIVKIRNPCRIFFTICISMNFSKTLPITHGTQNFVHPDRPLSVLFSTKFLSVCTLVCVYNVHN